MPASRALRISPSPTLAVSDRARRMRADGIDVVDLSAGEPDFPTPEAVKAAGRRAIDEDRTRYTANAGIPELRRAIAQSCTAARGVPCEAQAVLVSPGAKTSLYLACQALVEPGDRVVIPAPYWTSYPEQVRLAGGDPLFVDCPESAGFKLTGPALERVAAASRPRLVILNYPSNPTGACYSRGELEQLAQVALRHGLWIVADEIYSRLLFDGRRFDSIASIDADVAARTVLVDGMSKTYSMTGWRVGYAVGPRELIEAMANLQSHMTSNATSISQWAALAALGLPDSEIEPRVREFQRRRDELLGGLRGLDGVSCVEPQGAFYAFPNVSRLLGPTGGAAPRSAADLAAYLLERARVAVVPGEAFGSAEHVRLSYAVGLERLREGLERIARALAELG